jgi:hypothetical protein
MLTDKEQQFIQRWEAVRETESTFRYKFLSGLPVALLFALPILIFFIVVKLYFPSWFTTASHKSNDVIVPGMTQDFMKISTGDVTMAFIAVFVIVLFFSYFRMHYKWENNEQLYQELKSIEKKTSMQHN